MTSQNLSYALFDLSGTAGALLVIYSIGALKTLTTRRFLFVLTGQYLLWIAWDYLAVRLGVFSFPPEGNLPIRILGLPAEEHLFFPFHSILTWAVVVLAQAAKAARPKG
jgi:lycopene cyclase domain-containing protein